MIETFGDVEIDLGDDVESNKVPLSKRKFHNVTPLEQLLADDEGAWKPAPEELGQVLEVIKLLCPDYQTAETVCDDDKLPLYSAIKKGMDKSILDYLYSLNKDALITIPEYLPNVLHAFLNSTMCSELSFEDMWEERYGRNVVSKRRRLQLDTIDWILQKEKELMQERKETHHQDLLSLLTDEKVNPAQIKPYIPMVKVPDTDPTNTETPFMKACVALDPDLVDAFLKNDIEHSMYKIDRQVQTKYKHGNLAIQIAADIHKKHRALLKKEMKKNPDGPFTYSIRKTQFERDAILKMYREFPFSPVLYHGYCEETKNGEKHEKMVEILLQEIYEAVGGEARRGSILATAKAGTISNEQARDINPQTALIWTSIISYEAEDDEPFLPFVQELVLEKCDLLKVNLLANARSRNKGTALEAATMRIKDAIKERMLFMGRYKIQPGMPLHKSATSIVVLAEDMKAEDDYRKEFKELTKNWIEKEIKENDFQEILKKIGQGWEKEMAVEKFREFDVNDDKVMDENEWVKFCVSVLDKNFPRRVVLKFMAERDQWEREIKSRNSYKLNSLYIVDVLEVFSSDLTGFDRFYDGAENAKTEERKLELFHADVRMEGDEKAQTKLRIEKRFSHALKSEIDPMFRNYGHVIVMPGADRDLKSIYMSERPEPNQIRNLLHQIGGCLQHLHENNLIHGDLKMTNLVRISNNLHLIDFDAACLVDERGEEEYYAGAKFSSGTLPPEMIVVSGSERSEGS
jgi:hypothetical protein